LTSAFFSGNQLFTANAGDSRVILISSDDSDGAKKVKYKQLTTDHKPEMPNEK
jgi:serine/threonine protein phosphatase PrpC